MSRCRAIGQETSPNCPDASVTHSSESSSVNRRGGTALRAFAHPTQGATQVRVGASDVTAKLTSNLRAARRPTHRTSCGPPPRYRGEGSRRRIAKRGVFVVWLDVGRPLPYFRRRDTPPHRGATIWKDRP